MNSKYKIYEYLFPWMRLERIKRELNVEERIGSTKLYIEYWTKIWPKHQLKLLERKKLNEKA